MYTRQKIYKEKHIQTSQPSSGQVPTYCIDITIIIIQKKSVQHDITVTELNGYTCRTSESFFMVL